MAAKNTIFLWYDGAALEAARFYAETFPGSAVGAVCRAPGDYPRRGGAADFGTVRRGPTVVRRTDAGGGNASWFRRVMA